MGVMILLVWKISVEVYDKKEYKKFEMETNNANWSKASEFSLKLLKYLAFVNCVH